MTDFKECLRDLGDRVDGQLVSEVSEFDRALLDGSTTDYPGHYARELGCLVENCCVVLEVKMEAAEYLMFPIDGDCLAASVEE